ncbi:DUF115 domain-containing protein [Alteromonas ponticola]|uniref:DUF115 domain-containing protein n=1 Tax=Alteromonas aquimaris TaxID=2998417 RepID=A0ABT3P690_9ALTE|nr:6-hydroxymethylpterin diphosphokinase MptE-like protein [Alteromonas aquimaris]MCW8107596.1 DUF115 domain-containing protein [Alteromonas aquimaris]
MLKNVFLHVDEDKEIQNSIEHRASAEILQREQKNLAAFQRYMPPVYEQIFKISSSHISILCNKHSEMNIIHVAEGRTFYGLNPNAEVAEQVKQFGQRMLTFTLNDSIEHDVRNMGISGLDSPLARKLSKCDSAPSHIPVLVVLGIGGAMHLPQLVKQYQIDHLVVYEPDPAYFKCSLAMADWQTMLTVAAEKNTAIYMMLGEDGSNLADNLSELSSVVQFDEFTLFKHYNHPVFDQLISMLCEFPWQQFTQKAVKPQPVTRPEQFLEEFTYPINHSEWSRTKLDIAKFRKNLDAFKKFIPNLYDEFNHYYPEFWFPVANDEGQVNLLNIATMTPLYGSNPAAEHAKNIDAFKKYPNNDGLVLNFTGKKLKPYLHYQMVAEVDEVLKEVEDEQRSLPETVKAIILFGIGTGYGFEQLASENRLEKVFICEPNRDFFYASLFAIDWYKILEKIEQEDKRIYFNIGDDGTHLIEDLLTQFHTVGPYMLASTFFYQGYYNRYLTRAIQNLREQLQVIVSLGDYFDHSRYCIAHTRWGMENEIPALKADARQYLSADEKDTPVFIVGNGPSLDNLIDLIQEYQDQAIIVSCGTALKTLYKHGITPDFHAEIESNRATYDWTVRVGDLDYLKKITLLSCNGIHPDTCNLFKDVYIAFKEGESATVAISKLFDEFPYTRLHHAYPTVTNFVANFFTEVGFTQLYLIGVDLGFIDVKYHHSKSSGYYAENGDELFDFEENVQTTLKIEGNFRPFVETKYEFKLAITLLERALVRAKDVYNLNDGAKIIGAQSLVKEHVLITGSQNVKEAAISKLKQDCFYVLPSAKYSAVFDAKFKASTLHKELEELIATVSKPFESAIDAENFLNQQRSFVIGTYFRQQSLLFYYINGSLNFISSAIMKLTNMAHNDQSVTVVNRLREIWLDYLKQFLFLLKVDERSFCFISTLQAERRKTLIKYNLCNFVGSITTYPAEKKRYVNELLPAFGINEGKLVGNRSVVLTWGEDTQNLLAEGSEIVILENIINIELTTIFKKVLLLPGDWKNVDDSPLSNNIRRSSLALIASSSSKKISLLLGKVTATKLSDIVLSDNLASASDLYFYDCGETFIAVTTELLNEEEQILMDGTRVRLLSRPLRPKDLILSMQTKEEKQKMKSHLAKSYKSLAAEL